MRAELRRSHRRRPLRRIPPPRATRLAAPRRTLLLAASAFALTCAAGRWSSRAAVAQEATPCPPTTTDEARALADAYFAAFNAGDAEAHDGLLAADYDHHRALVAQQARELYKERLRTNRLAFPDGVYEM